MNRSRRPPKPGGLVYSSGHGRMCPTCRQPADRCSCSRKSAAPPTDGEVRVRRDTKKRKGSGVTLVTGVPLAGAELTRLAKDLKKKCGSGGTVKDGTIEIQGDHIELLVQELESRGWTVRSC